MPRSDQNNVASVADLVAQLKIAQRQMLELVNEHETEQFRLLEQKTVQIFSSIERREPADALQFRTIAQFYLELLEQDDGGYNKHLHDCLRHLIDRHADRCAGSETVEGGRI